MAILYGTTADGDSLPVEVNEFGQLIAQGLQGQEGPPGPPGSPGIGQLPPNPFEGALLGWEDGQLSWVGGSVPIPPGTFGPILSYEGGLITLAGEVSLLNGQAVFLSDSAGNRFYYQPAAQVLAVSGDVYTVDTDFDEWQVGDVIGGGGFAPVIYKGNGGTQSISCGFAPDFVWIKSRTITASHNIYDTIRGANRGLYADNNQAQNADTDRLTAFNSDGFDLGSNNATNGNDQDFVAWCWSASDTTVTNNEGTIQSQVRSNGDFSIVTYTGAASGTVGHGLGVAPHLIIAKSRTVEKSWVVYHKDLGINQYLLLNSTNAAGDTTGVWGSSVPTSTVFGLENSSIGGNTDGDLVAYCWAESPTQSFGKYTGTGDTNAIDCGFEPAFVMIKRTDVGNNWIIYDTARSPSNPANKVLKPDASSAEETFTVALINITSSGFEVLNGDPVSNEAGGSYIYAAFSGQKTSTVTDIDAAAGTLTIEGDSFAVGDIVSTRIKSGEGSVAATVGEAIVLRADNTEWLPGQYVTAPEQEIAARKVVGAQVRKSYKKD
jgi:hypothetical protein